MTKAEVVEDGPNPFNNHLELVTDPVFLIGNGKSRSTFDLERLRGVGTIMGCNALHRDFFPDILVAIDSKMLNELKNVKPKLPPEMLIVNPKGRGIQIPGSIAYKTGRFNTSGCFAIRLIGQVMQPTKCYMLGMDGYPGNVYDGTTNYAVHTLKNFKGVHNFYLEALKVSKQTMFINVNDVDGWPPEAENTGRYKCISYDEFEKTVMV